MKKLIHPERKAP